MEEKYYLEIIENNPDKDDITKIVCYEKLTNNLVGYIDIEEIFDGFDYFSEFMDEETYDEYFDYNELLLLQNIHVSPEYRKKDIGNFMMKKLFKEIIPNYFKNYNDIVLWRSCFNIPNNMKELFNNNILKKFYESFGFKEFEENQNYMYKKLNQ